MPGTSLPGKGGVIEPPPPYAGDSGRRIYARSVRNGVTAINTIAGLFSLTAGLLRLETVFGAVEVWELR